MRLVTSVTSLAVGLVVSLVTTGPVAQADDYYSYRDNSFVVESMQVSSRDVTVTRLGTAEVTFSVSTRDVPEELQQDEPPEYPEPAQADSTLQLVEIDGPAEGQVATLQRMDGDGLRNNTWRGVVHLAGPSRTLTFQALRRCAHGTACRFLHSHTAPSIRIRAVETPIIHVDRAPTTDVLAPSYSISGRVLTSSGKSFGRRVTVIVGRGQECWLSKLPGSTSVAGLSLRTGPDGTFRHRFDNRPDTSGAGAPLTRPHCVQMASGVADVSGGVLLLTETIPTLRWTARLPVAAPATMRRGKTTTIRSAAPLSAWTAIRLERLHGRTAWREVGWGPVRDSGRIDVEVKPAALGRHTYRVRSDDSRATSETFAIVTTK